MLHVLHSGIERCPNVSPYFISAPAASNRVVLNCHGGGKNGGLDENLEVSE